MTRAGCGRPPDSRCATAPAESEIKKSSPGWQPLQWFNEAWNWVAQNLGWTFSQRTLVALLMTGAVTAALDRAFGLLAAWRQKIWFFVVASLATLFLLGNLGSKPTSVLHGQVYYLAVAADSKPPVAVLTLNIVNSGSVQSIAYPYSLSTTIDSRTYIGIPITLPEKINMSIAGKLIEYSNADSIFTKTSYPIAPGGEVSGVGMFEFRQTPNGLLGRPATYVLKFLDAFGNSYETAADLTGSVEAPIADLPGLQQKVSPMPPAAAPAAPAISPLQPQAMPPQSATPSTK
jgi:hypothetical protein